MNKFILMIQLFMVVSVSQAIQGQESAGDSSVFSLFVGYSNYEFGKNTGTSQYGEDENGSLPLSGGFAPSIGAEWSFYPGKRAVINLGTAFMYVNHSQGYAGSIDPRGKEYDHHYLYASAYMMGLYPLLTDPRFRIQTGLGLFYDEILYSKTQSEFGDEHDYKVEGGGSHLDFVTRFNISAGRTIQFTPYFCYNLMSNCKIRYRDQVIINFPEGLRFGIITKINLR